jgi:hypothetical protein
MVVSSRTPEGEPDKCPICGGYTNLELSLQGDAPCPQCGVLRWIDGSPSHVVSDGSELAVGMAFLERLWDRIKRTYETMRSTT